MFKPVNKIDISGRKSLNIIDLIDIISINNLIENDPDIVCFSYIPESGFTQSDEELISSVNLEGFKVDFVLTLDKEKFYIVRKIFDDI